MVDIRAIARAPHPTGSVEHERVRSYLVGRLRGLGLQVEVVPAPLSPRGRRRLARWGSTATSVEASNIVALLPGRDRSEPAAALMAHYDTVANSPGAADDSAGVAAALEIARALRAGGPSRRDVVILLTDAEELNSDGAAAFFRSHLLAARIGGVVNLEARGGGGRALMFETGRDNGGMMGLFGRTVRAPSANSLAVMIYRIMPNASDFSVVRAAGVPGFNFAFLGRPGLYHTPEATPDAVEAGSVQHLGGQALDIVWALADAPSLPPPAPDAVFADLFGSVLLIQPRWAGWALVGLASGLLALVAWRVGPGDKRSWREALRGLGAGAGLVGVSAVLLNGLNWLSGAGPSADYYDRLAMLPRLEVQAVLVCLAVGAAVAGPRTAPPPWARWCGLAMLVLGLAAAVQAGAPGAGPVVVWPLMLGAVAMAGAAVTDPRLARPWTVPWLAGAGALAGGQVLAWAHLAFLGAGADLPAPMALFLLLWAVVLWPLLQGFASWRVRLGLSATLLAGAVGVALWVRLDLAAQA
jgi:hypothetical protein